MSLQQHASANTNVSMSEYFCNIYTGYESRDYT